MFKLALRVMSGGPEKTLQKKKNKSSVFGWCAFYYFS